MEALVGLFGDDVRVEGASRTDAGVHARDQLACATIRHPIRCEGFIKALNRRLPRDVSVLRAIDVPIDFRPRFAARGKWYCYRMHVGRERRPLVDRVAWRVPWAVDWSAVAAAAVPLVGVHDFTSFAARDRAQRSALRTVTSITLRPEAAGVVAIDVRGRAFLKQMVRNIVGTLVEVGRGRWPATYVAEILAAQDRKAAGPTAPAHGLTLERVWIDAATTLQSASTWTELTDGPLETSVPDFGLATSTRHTTTAQSSAADD